MRKTRKNFKKGGQRSPAPSPTLSVETQLNLQFQLLGRKLVTAVNDLELCNYIMTDDLYAKFLQFHNSIVFIENLLYPDQLRISYYPKKEELSFSPTKTMVILEESKKNLLLTQLNECGAIITRIRTILTNNKSYIVSRVIQNRSWLMLIYFYKISHKFNYTGKNPYDVSTAPAPVQSNMTPTPAPR